MGRMSMASFTLDPRLAKDSMLISRLGLCELRLINDARWPWLILVPQRAGIVEFFDLTPLDQTMLTFETSLVAEALKKAANCDKINLGTLGNVVEQFHYHLVARNKGDANWPGPVWGHGKAIPWNEPARDILIENLLEAF